MNRLFSYPIRILILGSLLFTGFVFMGTGPIHGETFSRRNTVVEAVEKASPAVVSITTEQIEERSPFSSRTRDPFFDQFFQDFFNSFGPREYKTHSQGSGVIISPEGYILTNDHVVAQATRITVHLANEEDHDATLVGSDPKSDLSVLKVQAPGPLPFIRMGQSDDLMIGETVIAIGNPFSLSHTVTTGVISALNRSIRSGERVYQDFIQTDASINPGNSGGPLLNINGELIGINTAIYQKAEGIGFAIPINRARRIYEDLVAFGKVQKPWLGIFLQDLTPQMVQYFNLPNPRGVLISKIIEESPAQRAGIREGDIIVKIGKKEVPNRDAYLTLIESFRIGEEIPITLIRKGEIREFPVQGQKITPEKAMLISREWLGLEVEESTNKDSHRGNGGGVVVTTVNKHSEAFRIGIRPGDIIRQINNTRIKGVEDYQKSVEQAVNSENTVLLVVRNNVGYYVTLTE